MNVVQVLLAGGLGNQMFQYAFARAYAERIGAELRVSTSKYCPASTGLLGRLFGIEYPPADQEGCVPVESSVFEDWDGQTNVTILGMAQQQKNLIYGRRQAREWFTLRPELVKLLVDVPSMELVANLRQGDYTFACNPFSWISRESYEDCCSRFGLFHSKIYWLDGETHYRVPQVPVEKAWVELTDDEKMHRYDYLPDLALMMRAEVLMRANSTFSWWAAALGNARVFSPDVSKVNAADGIVNGQRVPQFVPFVEGNHPPVVWEPATTSELHLAD